MQTASAKSLVLLGAGASVDAGVPDAFTLTEYLMNRVSSDAYAVPHVERLLKLIVGGLVYRQSTANRDPLRARVNIEELYNALELLIERRESEMAPFISAYSGDLENAVGTNARLTNGGLGLAKHLERTFKYIQQESAGRTHYRLSLDEKGRRVHRVS